MLAPAFPSGGAGVGLYGRRVPGWRRVLGAHLFVCGFAGAPWGSYVQVLGSLVLWSCDAWPGGLAGVAGVAGRNGWGAPPNGGGSDVRT